MYKTLNAINSAKIKISNDCPGFTGHPPKRSSTPHALFSQWFRTITGSVGLTLICKAMSCGEVAGPVRRFIVKLRRICQIC